MKLYRALLIALSLLTLSLYADQGRIRYQFTVTQIAIDIQQSQMETTDMIENDDNTTTETSVEQ